MKQAILLTGFEPFGGEAVNPSWEVARALHGEWIAGAQVHAVQLPCVFHQALGALQAAIRETQPRLVLALGQAGAGSAPSGAAQPAAGNLARRYTAGVGTGLAHADRSASGRWRDFLKHPLWDGQRTAFPVDDGQGLLIAFQQGENYVKKGR